MTDKRETLDSIVHEYPHNIPNSLLNVSHRFSTQQENTISNTLKHDIAIETMIWYDIHDSDANYFIPLT